MTAHIIDETNAAKMAEWLRTRGGLAIWPSVNLSNPSASWTTPANGPDGTPTPKPTWEATDKPERIITDPNDVLVSRDIEVKRFRIGVRVGSQGMSLKVTDGGTRRIRRAVMNAGQGAWYRFDYSTQEAVILKPQSQVPLPEFLRGTNGN